MHRVSFSPSKKFDRCMCVIYVYIPTIPEREREKEGVVSVSHLLDKLLQHIEKLLHFCWLAGWLVMSKRP